MNQNKNVQFYKIMDDKHNIQMIQAFLIKAKERKLLLENILCELDEKSLRISNEYKELMDEIRIAITKLEKFNHQ